MIRLCAEHVDKIKRAGKHIMVDEYQDVDRFQFDIVCELARKPGVDSFVVVGDPNQRIYAWRGALDDAFSSMELEFPEAQTLSLTQNFRSKDAILEHAETICCVGMTGVKGGGKEAVIHGGFNDVVKDLQKTSNLSQVAILCRINRDCMRWQLDLAKQGWPVYLMGSGDFWNAKHVKLAKEVWQRNGSDIELFESDEWKKFSSARRFRDDEDRLNECIADCKWLLGLSKEDMTTMNGTFQRERDGIRISTIHKTKGMEFDRVLISGVTERLVADTFVYYVAVTRPRDLLVLG
jgi:superfamily I DNA/RNA helicase